MITCLLLWHWLTPTQRKRYRLARAAQRHLSTWLIRAMETVLYNYALRWSNDNDERFAVVARRWGLVGWNPTINGHGIKCMRTLPAVRGEGWDHDEMWWKAFALGSERNRI